MNKLLNRVCNWTFGSMFRVFGRIIAFILLILLLNFLSSKGIIRIPHLLSFMKVNAQVIADYENNPTWLYYGANAELIDTSQNSCISGKTKAQISELMPLNNNTPNSGSIFKSGISGGIKASDFYTDDVNSIKSIYNIQLGIRPPADTYWLTSGTYTYYINVLVSTGRRGIVQDWEGYPINDGSLLEGVNYSNSQYWSFVSRGQSDDSLTFKINEVNPNSNMVWLTYKVTYNIQFPIAQTWGLGFNVFIPTTSYIYCESSSGSGNDSSGGGSSSGGGRHDNDIGSTNWFYINDYIVEKDSHDDSLLTFNYEGVDDTGYWSNDDYKNPNQGSGGDIDDDINNFPGLLPPGPLDSVLTLPLGIMNSLNQRIQSSCSSLTINIPFLTNKTLIIPCISSIFSSIPGLNSFLDFLGAIASGIIMYNYLIYLYQWVDDITSLKHTRQRLFGAKSDADNWGGVE